mgnify:CR=1 FL=1
MLEHKLPAVGFEDCFCVVVLGHKAFDFVPEGFLMMAEPEMGKFVDDDVLGNDFGGKEDAGVDDDAVFGSAAPPLAFLKPDAGATVWREQPYELFVDGKWETGQFDRVVFSGAGETRTATIYDFKTNAKGVHESDEAFVRRMKESYAGQMADYRAAIGRLTGLPPSRIQAKLLLQATGMVVEMP